MNELGRLVKISRGVIAERDLVCPACGGVPVLTGGILVCGCGAKYSALAELKAVERKRAKYEPESEDGN